MRGKPSTKLTISILGIILLLFVSAPAIFSCGWQLIHGEQVTLEGVSLRLDPGWVVFRNSIARIREDMLFRSSEESLITVHAIPECQSEQAAALILIRLRNFIAKDYSGPSTQASILVGGKPASCFIMTRGISSGPFHTVCLASGSHALIDIQAKDVETQGEAIHILQSAPRNLCLPPVKVSILAFSKSY